MVPSFVLQFFQVIRGFVLQWRDKAVDKIPVAWKQKWQSIWQDEERRGLFLQGVAIFVVLAIFLYSFSNVVENFSRVSKNFSFDFLFSPANYEINADMALIDFSPSDTHLRAAMVGVLGTINITFWGCGLAVILGFLIALARLSPNFLLSRLALVYIETIRNIPLLIQIIFWNIVFATAFPPPESAIHVAPNFFLSNDGLALPKFIFSSGGGYLFVAALVMAAGLFLLKSFSLRHRLLVGEPLHPILVYGLGIILLALPIGVAFFVVQGEWQVPTFGEYTFELGARVPAVFMSLLLGLSLFAASYIAETVRAALLAIAKGQSEAGMAIGLSRGQINRLVLVPQALRMIIPPLSSELIGLLKNSALAVAVGYVDIGTTLASSTLNITGREMECMLLAISFYLVLSLTMSLVINYYNKQISLRM